ncbi:hypothetical protein HDV02_006514, partial [Globomyces sp. JEL0801]
NYADHAKELGNSIPTQPFFFLKPSSSILIQSQNKSIEIPKNCDVHHELELGVVIGKTGRDIQPSHADSFISGYCLALDMTARNLQNQAKKSGLPWSAAKGYDTFTPIGQFIPKNQIPNPNKLQLSLTIDGKMVQNGNTSDMIFDIPTLIHHVSQIMTLEEGDVILTGTPAGVGPVLPNQTLNGKLVDEHDQLVSEIQFTSQARS